MPKSCVSHAEVMQAAVVPDTHTCTGAVPHPVAGSSGGQSCVSHVWVMHGAMSNSF